MQIPGERARDGTQRRQPHRDEDCKEFFDFLDARARQTIKTFEEKKGKGIYERVFIFLDSKAINHNLPEVKTLDGTTTFHEFNDTGKQGEVTTRVLS